MKRIVRGVLAIVIVAAALATLVSGLIRSGSFDAPVKPKVTVGSLQKRLTAGAGAARPGQSAKPAPTPSPAPQPKQRLAAPQAASPGPQPATAVGRLPNTGAGNTIALFILVSGVATAAHMTWQTNRLRLAKRSVHLL